MTEAILRTAHTCRLAPAALDEIRAFLDTAFEGDFGDDDWDHGLGGIHAWVRDGSGLLAHGSVVQRRVVHLGRSYRIGYVEAVAVRADRRREGLGGRITAALEEVVDGAYAFGALSASAAGAALYAGRGWRVWPGRIAVQARYGVERLPDEEDSTFVRGAAGRGLPAGSGTLVFDWRDGDVM
ncbi:GNAT family N-acetyltransferase [Streptomyces atratus]|uniref:Aminoglycoside 2'-N-acetyltransferase I n=1 Tax=Streptomyces atratus TaxID=1893 RepID=A0A1K2DTV0_STRAR|nr:GNAT family N-acetyltransferase [Streptomyces atratus]SFY26807.1 aminoglycoside 2'-N-acetyltransferase I [Streptomyces atratus]